MELAFTRSQSSLGRTCDMGRLSCGAIGHAGGRNRDKSSRQRRKRKRLNPFGRGDQRWKMRRVWRKGVN